MIGAVETQQVARLMLRRHGLQALALAELRAAEMRAQGDVAGSAAWTGIGAMIAEFRRSNHLPARRGARRPASPRIDLPV